MLDPVWVHWGPCWVQAGCGVPSGGTRRGAWGEDFLCMIGSMIYGDEKDIL